MMKIIYKQGSMFSHEFPEDQTWYAFAHGCNAQGVMGSGVATQIKNLFPTAYQRYKEVHKKYGLHLGSYVDDWEGRAVVFNMITQKYYGRDKSVVYVSYEAITECFKDLDRCAAAFIGGNPPQVVMPKIGAGLANGDWNIIEKIIEENSNNFQPIVYTL